MAKLYFRYGAMGSSKTANAVMVQYNYRERGQQVLMLKPKIENRDGATVVRSRCGLVAQCRYVEELGGIDLTGIDCIIVDECHFMNAAQVRQLVDIVDEREIPVICYGLRTDFRGELFEGSRELLREHAIGTAQALSAMNPEYVGLLTLMVEPGTPLAKWVREGSFEVLGPVDILRETELFLQHIDSPGSVFRMNHASNYLTLKGTLNDDRAALLARVQEGLRGHGLRPESMRAL